MGCLTLALRMPVAIGYRLGTGHHQDLSRRSTGRPSMLESEVPASGMRRYAKRRLGLGFLSSWHVAVQGCAGFSMGFSMVFLEKSLLIELVVKVIIRTEPTSDSQRNSRRSL